jgi:hypothetical protein
MPAPIPEQSTADETFRRGDHLSSAPTRVDGAGPRGCGGRTFPRALRLSGVSG